MEDPWILRHVRSMDQEQILLISVYRHRGDARSQRTVRLRESKDSVQGGILTITTRSGGQEGTRGNGTPDTGHAPRLVT